MYHATDKNIPSFVGPEGLALYSSRKRVLVIDFETTNLTNGAAIDQANHLVLACWSIFEDGYRVDKHIFGDEYAMQPLLDDIRDSSFIVAHNAKFELQWLSRCGLDLRDAFVYDTMVSEWVIQGNRRAAYDLDSVARRYGVGVKESLVSKLIKNGINPADIPQSWLLEYCKVDVDVCYKVFLEQIKEIDEQDVWHLVLQRNLVVPVLADIEMQGLELDKDRVYAEEERLQNVIEELGGQLDEITGGINLGSPKQLGEFLYDRIGFAAPLDNGGKVIATPGGSISTAEPALAKLVATTGEQRKFLKLYKEYNKATTLLTKNVAFFKKVCDEKDGKFFGQLRQCRTANHRLASTGSPIIFKPEKGKNGKDKKATVSNGVQIQNLPRQYKSLFTVHDDDYEVTEYDGCFTAGHRLLMSDLSWKNVEDIREGDEVVGIDENLPENNTSYRGLDRKMRTSVVEATKVRPAEIITMNLADGTTICVSKEHPFMIKDSSSRGYRWETAEWISKCNSRVEIRKLCDVIEDRNPRAWGKLAAYVDGEGHWAHDKMTLSQQDNSDVLLDMRSVLDELNIPYNYRRTQMSAISTKTVANLVVTGMRNLIAIQQLGKPVKSLRNKGLLWENKSPKGHAVGVLSCESGGTHDVYSIQTSTKTYVCEGLISHNCQIEFRVAAELGHDKQAEADIVNGVDIHSFTRDTMNSAWLAAAIKKEIDRQGAKPQTFAPLYGSQGSDVAEQGYAKAFAKKYYGIRAAQDDWTLTVADRKKLTTPYGLTFHWPNATMHRSGYVSFSTEIFNLPISGFATGEIIPIALVFFWHRIKDTHARIFNTVHDSLIVFNRKPEKHYVTEIAKIAMTYDVYSFLDSVYDYQFSVPLGFGCKSGSHWGESSAEFKWDIWPTGEERLQVEVNKEVRVMYDTRNGDDVIGAGDAEEIIFGGADR